MKKQTTLFIIIIIVVALVAFYAGKSYGATHKASTTGNMMGGTYSGMGGNRGTMRNNGGFIVGKVISKDATSITVQSQNGSSRIIFISPSTTVQKATAGTLDDVIVGSDVMVSGTPNQDGSVNAQTVNLRPAGSMPSATTPVQK